MKKQFIRMGLFLFCIFGIIAIAGIFCLERYVAWAGEAADAQSGLVLLNEIEQLTKEDEGENPAKEAIGLLREQLRQETTAKRRDVLWQIGALAFGTAAVCLLFLFFMLYFKIVKPFWKLENYAGRLAKGDLSVSLQYERTNFFGAFTWAFDHMRKEILDARRNEEKAITENKTIIATLSHDIKTPIASIRAYAEGLEANLEADYEQRERYLQVIIKKCDEVTRLVNDLVLHSLSELNKLEVKKEPVRIGTVLQNVLEDFAYAKITVKHPIPDAELLGDSKRLAQAFLNLLENAKKYAPEAEMLVWAQAVQNPFPRYEIHLRDYGEGIAPEDMPFVTQKFYRGQNAADRPGSGLGLYIVTYIMERMDGGLELRSHENGLEAVIWLPMPDVFFLKTS